MAVDGWTLTPHAKQRRKEMHVTEHQILRALTDPEHDSPSQQHCTRRWAFLDTIVVVYEPSTSEIITILWRSETELTREEARVFYAKQGA